MVQMTRSKHVPWTPRDKANLRKGLLFISLWLVGLAAFTLFPLIYIHLAVPTGGRRIHQRRSGIGEQHIA